MRLLILFLVFSCAGCAATNKDSYEAVCGSASGYFYSGDQETPINVEQDYLEKVPLDALECRAGEGDYFAQYNLGRLYLQGIRVEQDYARAADLFLAAGSETFNDYYEQRGFRYMPGFGNNLTVDKTSGFPPAQYALGLMFYSGLLGEKDTKMAIFWMEKAAALGNREASEFLARTEKE